MHSGRDLMAAVPFMGVKHLASCDEAPFLPSNHGHIFALPRRVHSLVAFPTIVAVRYSSNSRDLRAAVGTRALGMGVKPRSVFRSWTFVAVDPFEDLLLGPTYATAKASFFIYVHLFLSLLALSM